MRRGEPPGILPRVSNELLPLGRRALGVGADSLRVGHPFVVFAVVVAADESAALRWYVDASDEIAAQRARHETANSDCQRYAIVAHEEVRDREGVLRPAMVAEVGDRNHDEALRIAQPYEAFDGPDVPLKLIGNPIVLGDTVNVLRGSAIDPGKPASFVAICPKCKKRNRVSLARARARLPKCGACSESLLHK